MKTRFGNPKIFSHCQTPIHLKIYNRWGNKVFATRDLTEGWDGMNAEQEAPMGVYSYYITYKSLNGIPIEERGSFTLYRNKAN